ncbi:MAG: hypothetical protein KBA46_02460, partial [Candidatus Omnitrophica bacterium]|nr:hypothetical protein [Candidatus Omnitrophota bacterium]
RGAGVMMDFPLKANDFVAMDIPANFFLKERLHRLARVAWCSKISERLWRIGFDFGIGNEITFA